MEYHLMIFVLFLPSNDVTADTLRRAPSQENAIFDPAASSVVRVRDNGDSKRDNSDNAVTVLFASALKYKDFIFLLPT